MSDLKDAIAVYCKGNCGKIIYAATKEGYRNKESKREVDLFFRNGNKIGKVSNQEVRDNFGCSCNHKFQTKIDDNDSPDWKGDLNDPERFKGW